MKMAKASEADLEMAFELANALEALSSRWGGFMPERIEKPTAEDENERFSLDDPEQCRRVCEYLIRLTRSASIGRVVFGMAVLLDPINKIVDPDADTIEHHPERKDSQRLRWLLEDHADPVIREHIRSVLQRLPVMGYGAATQWIDAMVAESERTAKPAAQQAVQAA